MEDDPDPDPDDEFNPLLGELASNAERLLLWTALPWKSELIGERSRGLVSVTLSGDLLTASGRDLRMLGGGGCG